MARRSEYKRLERAIREAGFEVVPAGSGHRKVIRPGAGCVMAYPATCSDRRGFRNTVAQLRRVGVLSPEVAL